MDEAINKAINKLKLFWNFKSQTTKIEESKKILNLLKSNFIDLNYEIDQEIMKRFHDSNVNLVVNKLDDDILGLYNPVTNIITISEDIVNSKVNCALTIYRLLAHELMHFYQNFLITNSNLFCNNTSLKTHIDALKIARDGYDLDFQFCGLSGKISLHFHPIDIINREINTLSNMFFSITAMERDAYMYEEKKINEFKYANKVVKNKRNDYLFNIDEYIEFFKTRYKCNDLSKQNLFDLTDECMYMLATHKNPREMNNKKFDSDLVATIMFDMMAIGKLEYSILSRKTDHISLLKSLKDYENLIRSKELILSRNDYIIYGSGTRKYNGHVILENASKFDLLKKPESFYYDNIDNFKTLSLDQQKHNPHLLLMSIIYNGKEIVPYIKDIEALRAYVIENLEIIKNMTMTYESLLNVFGKDFFELNFKGFKNEDDTKGINDNLEETYLNAMYTNEKNIYDNIDIEITNERY